MLSLFSFSSRSPALFFRPQTEESKEKLGSKQGKGGKNFFAIYFYLMRENWSRRTLSSRRGRRVCGLTGKVMLYFREFIEIDIYLIGRLNAII
mgnify:CR=1 FL=1